MNPREPSLEPEARLSADQGWILYERLKICGLENNYWDESPVTVAQRWARGASSLQTLDFV
jgi:hypothetical protein